MTITNDQTETLLHEGLVQPPPDFRDNVMQRIAEHERSGAGSLKSDQPVRGTGVSWWQWLILLPSSAIGAAQMMRFIFSMWFVTTAG